MIRGTDGLDYETLSDRLVGIPAITPRNAWLKNCPRRTASEKAIWDRLAALPADATGPQCADCLPGVTPAAI